ncbi:anti-sigma factor family protein [Ensifer soli]|uniref:anti-sigma factor family protein n=1 Tax=Ciceribacter sp. sgz301302 TaxID=3342379 RepID=UPI0035B9051F
MTRNETGAATDPILESDLDAYVDDQLDLARRIAVEAHLSMNPEGAARVMADLSIRGELRLALANQATLVQPATRDAARRLERGLSQGRMLSMLRRIAAVAALVTAGWVANATFQPFHATEVVASTPVPAYVEEAIRAHRTEALRGTMASQAPAAMLDADDIRAATAIVLPDLPESWRVSDVQIFPSDFGPSVEVAITPEEGRRLSLFAVRPGTFAVRNVSHYESGGVDAVYWQIGEVAYALVSDHEADAAETKPQVSRLDQEAVRLARTLY